jgi:hypothetical protein
MGIWVKWFQGYCLGTVTFGTERPRNGCAATSALNERSRLLLAMTPTKITRKKNDSYRYITDQWLNGDE